MIFQTAWPPFTQAGKTCRTSTSDYVLDSDKVKRVLLITYTDHCFMGNPTGGNDLAPPYPGCSRTDGPASAAAARSGRRDVGAGSGVSDSPHTRADAAVWSETRCASALHLFPNLSVAQPRAAKKSDVASAKTTVTPSTTRAVSAISPDGLRFVCGVLLKISTLPCEPIAFAGTDEIRHRRGPSSN